MNKNRSEVCNQIFDYIKDEISKKEFEENLKEVQKIDSKHYKEKITVEDMKKCLAECKIEEQSQNENKKIIILTHGNPEIVFKICLEILQTDVEELIIGIQDFCLGQNTLLIEVLNKIIKNNNLKKKFKLENCLKDNEIIEKSKNVDKVICVGDSNLYNRLENKITNIELNPYGIFEVYSDSEEFEELERTFFEYCYQNEFEAEDYSDLEFEDAIRLINKNGYKFSAVLFSKDESKQKEFKEKISSKYIIINKNPFKEIKFKL